MGRLDIDVCGTHTGYRRHDHLGTPACEPCMEANRVYRRERYGLNQRDYKKSYYQENKELYVERRAKYIEANPDYRAGEDRRRRANILNNGSEPYTLLEVLETYGAVCHLCSLPIDMTLPRQSGTPGWQLGLHIDHVIPIAKGGPDTLANVKPSHAVCNLSKGASHR
jgi:5-methylcytosine-specific restriction endonuclease McrA